MVSLQVNRDVCIGAGLCVLADERVFDQDDEGIVMLIGDPPAHGEGVRKAVRNCPSGALRLAQE
jgi:ferredoxin